MDVYKDSATRDKLIFPSAITRLLCHFDVPFPSSDPFPVMGATDAGTVKSSEAQLRSRQSGSIATMTPSAPSTFDVVRCDSRGPHGTACAYGWDNYYPILCLI